MENEPLLIAIVVDMMGCLCLDKTPDDEIADIKERMQRLLGKRKLEFYTPGSPDLKPGTDILVYDFGGMLPGCDDLLRSNARQIIRMCQDNPNFTALIFSSFTYRHQIRYELDELGMGELPNLINFESDDDLPAWLKGLEVEEPPRRAFRAFPSPFAQLRFFEPNDSFLDWITRRANGRIIIDAGCGEGHVTEALIARGEKAIGVDLNPRDGQNDYVVLMDARDFNYPKGSLVMFARPCHSDWVVGAIEQAVAYDASEILYVGFAKNLRSDLGAWAEQFDQVLANAGKEEECVWSMRV